MTMTSTLPNGFTNIYHKMDTPLPTCFLAHSPVENSRLARCPPQSSTSTLDRTNLFPLPPTQITDMTDTIPQDRGFRGTESPIDTFLTLHGINSVPVRAITYTKVDGSIGKKFQSLRYDLGLTFAYGQNLFLPTNALNLRLVQNNWKHKKQLLLQRYGNSLRGALDTTDVYVVDVDDCSQVETPAIHELMQTSAYYMSIGKNLPKIFIRVQGTGLPLSKNIPLVRGPGSPLVELQKGQWSWYNYHQPVFNSNTIRTLTVDELRALFPDMASKKEVETITRSTPRPKEDQDDDDEMDAAFRDKEPITESTMTTLLSLLKDSRADDRKDWLSIAFILKYHLPEDEALALFQQFSQRSPKYRPHEDEVFFHGLRPSGLANVKYLKWMAFKDNPEAYCALFPDDATFHKRLLLNKVGHNSSVSVNHQTLAQLYALSHEESDKFRFEYLTKSGQWYSVQPNQVWEMNAGKLMNSVSSKCVSIIETRFSEPMTKEDWEHKGKVISSLQSATKIDGTLRFIKELLTDKGFKNKLDTNFHLLAFTDVVFDLTHKDYRPIEPSDMIMTTLGYARPTVDPVIRAELQTFVNSLFENDAKTAYLMKVLASCLFNGNVQQEFYILTGYGSNGKSLLMTLLSTAMGGYMGSINYTALTKKPKEDNQASDWPKTKPMRLVITSEPDSKSQLQGNVLKSITGGDAMSKRELYSNNTDWVPMFIPLLIANEVPRMDNIDEAMARRLRVINFPFQFKLTQDVDQWDETIHRVRNGKYPINFKESKYGQQFLLMLLDVYLEHLHDTDRKTVFAVENIPRDFINATDDYCNTNNIVIDFLGERYIVVDYVNIDNSVSGKAQRERVQTEFSHTAPSLWQEYKEWVSDKDARKSDKYMSQRSFTGYLNAVPDIGKCKYKQSGTGMQMYALRPHIRPRPSVHHGGGAYAPGFHPGGK